MDKSQCCYQFLFSIEIDARDLYLYLRIHVPIIRTCTKFESNRITFTGMDKSKCFPTLSNFYHEK